MPYAEAAGKWGEDMLNYALDKGMGVGTHCDFSTTNTPNTTVTAKDFKNLKEKVDAIVGASNNLGCSGGFGAENWVQAAHDGGFSYLDAPVMNVYLRIPEENRPINPETNKPYTDEEIEKVYYHDPAPPDIRDRIYPRMLKDVQDLEEDKDGILNRTLDFAITVRVITQFIQSLLIMPDNNYQLTAKAFLLKAAYCYDNKREASHILDSQGKATEDINHLAKWMKEVVRSSQGEDSISNRNQFTIR